MPRLLGALVAFAGFGWLVGLSGPHVHGLSSSIMVLGTVAEGALMLWLLVKGIDVSKWHEQTTRAHH